MLLSFMKYIRIFPIWNDKREWKREREREVSYFEIFEADIDFIL